ncbi:hypothetical protein JXJ21_14440 [candidate division KSB1 bacterium]|nr:hypothetical protein [candidate division KSB1 bacterium]
MPIRYFFYLFAGLLTLNSVVLFAQKADISHLRQYASHLPWTKALSDEELLKLAQEKYTCFVVPHTHWDKEWGFSFEQHNLRLVKLVDNVIEILENDRQFRCFLLDGQSSLIDDYLDTRPEMLSRIRALVESDRLLLGPWYTQIDMLVSSGEEMVRNLLAGIQSAENLGKCMHFGYTADNFGFCAQLPQIYRGFGIPRAALYRGPVPGTEMYKTAFEWVAPDGSSVTVANFAGPAGYLLFTWAFDVPGMAEAYLLKSLHFLTPIAVTDKLMLPAGSDATEVDASLPRVLKRLHAEFLGLTFKIASPDEYLDAVLADAPTLPVHRGALRSRKGSCIGSISSRMDLKQANARAYTNLEHFAEPANTFAWLTTGRRYPATSFERAWKLLFENLSHDDMGGACFEKVYLVNHARYFEANRLAETLAIRGLKTLFEAVKTPDKSDILHKPVIVFNPLPWQRTDIAELWIPLRQHGGALRNPFKDGAFTSYVVKTLNGDIVPNTVSNEMHAEDESEDYLRVRFLAAGIPSCGYKTFQLAAVKSALHRDTPRGDITEIENQYLKLSFHPDGRFDLLDKETGMVYPALHHFEDQHTPGSAWNFSMKGAIRTTIGEPADITLVEDNPVSRTMRVRWQQWRVPTNREEGEMVLLPITSFITLNNASKQVAIYTEVENGAFDHRLRVAFPAPVSADSFDVGVQFGAERQPVYDPQNPPDSPWELEFYPHHDWVDVSDGECGLALLDRGTPAVSVYRTDGGTKLLLTLLRAYRSYTPDVRHSILTNRFGSEKFNTDAQLQGVQRFHYRIFPHRGNWQTAAAYREGANANVRLWTETLWRQDQAKWSVGPYGFEDAYVFPEGHLPAEQSFIRIEPPDAVISAIKRSEAGNDLIVRFYNASSERKAFKLKLYLTAKDVQAVNLKEENAGSSPEIGWRADSNKNTIVDVSLNKFQILTLKFAVDTPPEKRWYHTKY